LVVETLLLQKRRFSMNLLILFTKTTQKQPFWIGGDFNTNKSEDKNTDLIDKFNLTELSNATHTHKGDNARQIDYLFTNYTVIKSKADIHHSLENKAILDKSLDHQCFILTINKTNTPKNKQIKRTDWPNAYKYLDGEIKQELLVATLYHNLQANQSI